MKIIKSISIMFLLVFIVEIAFCFEYYKFEDKTKNFIASDMNTVMIALLTEKSIMVFLILSKFMNIREPFFLAEIPFQDGKDIFVLEYNIFVLGGDGVTIFRAKKGKIEFVKNLEEKEVIQIEKSYNDWKNFSYFFYKKNSISVYDEYFNKIKEEDFPKGFNFVIASEDQSIFKDKNGDYYFISFDSNLNIYKERKFVKGEILSFSRNGNFISIDNNTILIYGNFEVERRINPYKDLMNLPMYKGFKKLKVNKVLFIRNKLLIFAELFRNDIEEKLTIVYNWEGKFCKVETPSISEIFGIDIEGNQFGDILFLSKNIFEFFCHGGKYSCGSIID